MDEASDSGDFPANDLDREWQSRQAGYYNVGYLEGIEEGKHETVQEGFDAGYAAGSKLGYEWGVLRGAATTLAATTSKHTTTNTPPHIETTSSSTPQQQQPLDILNTLKPGVVPTVLLGDPNDIEHQQLVQRLSLPSKEEVEQIYTQVQHALQQQGFDITTDTK